MYKTEITAEEITERLKRTYGCTPSEAGAEELYFTLSEAVRERLSALRRAFDGKARGKKRVYYFSMEFLVGRRLKFSLLSLGQLDRAQAALAAAGSEVGLDDIFAVERDPGLGNGGLGRLAACYIASLASCGYPATGFSLLYEKGFFAQKIKDGEQIELPDEWLGTGTVWLERDESSRFTVELGGRIVDDWTAERRHVRLEGTEKIDAVAYDLVVPGYLTPSSAVIRLWRADPARDKRRDEWGGAAVTERLYPSDEQTEGKLLRLTQQYFLVSASVNSIVRDHLAVFGSLGNLGEKVAIHVNDTHPALVIPELMRVLMDNFGESWDTAWRTVKETVSYTNHTVMPEALETWNSELFRLRLPRIFEIVREINERTCREAWDAAPGDFERVSRMAIEAYSRVRMANLAAASSHSINGVSAMHTDIIKRTVFRDRYGASPTAFLNVTNGVSHVRWLIGANPALTALIREAIGDAFERDTERLADLLAFREDKAFLGSLINVKKENKRRFSAFCKNTADLDITPDSVFDVQIKRIHEYKRQLMNVLKILYLYRRIKEDSSFRVPQTTFIFGGKAAPSYRTAKSVLRLICSVGEKINADPAVRGVLRVAVAEDYGVTSAEFLIPAADLSEQISLAGKEASGTGCMKMMMNGAVLVGTRDGANPEIVAAAGEENAYLFGATADEAAEVLRRGYRSGKYYIENERVRFAVDALAGEHDDIVKYLLYSGATPDPYMCLYDLDPYICAWENAAADTEDEYGWAKKSLHNIAASGFFSSDRAVREYAEKIWKTEKLI